MSTGKQVVLTFTADAAGLNTALTKINGDLGKLQGSGEKAGAGISKGLQAADKTLNQTGSNAMRLGGALAQLSPEAGALASGLGKLAVAADVAALAQGAMAGGIGTVTVALKAQTIAALSNPIILGLTIGIAAVGAAYALLSSELDKSTKKMEASAELATRAAKGYGTFSDQVTAAVTAQKVASGETSQVTVTLNKNIDALKLAYEETKRLDKERNASTEVVAANAKQYQKAKLALYETATLERRMADETKKGTGAIKENTDALKQNTEEEKQNARVSRAIMQRESERGLASQALLDSVVTAGRTEREQLQATAQERDDAFAKQIEQYSTDSDAYRKLTEARLAARAQELAKLEAFDAQQLESAQELAEAEKGARLEAASATTDSLIGLAQTLNDIQLAGIDTTTKAGRAAALQQWEQNKGASLAMATVQAALAVAMAVASAPPPFNIPAIIQNTAAGLAAIASISAAPPPKFHAGTSRVDEVNATLKKGEAVLSTQGVSAAGRDVVGRWNSGRSAGADKPMVIQYRHQVFNRFIRDNLRMATPLASAVKSGSPVGFKDRG